MLYSGLVPQLSQYTRLALSNLSDGLVLEEQSGALQCTIYRQLLLLTTLGKREAVRLEGTERPGEYRRIPEVAAKMGKMFQTNFENQAKVAKVFEIL